MKEFFTVFLFLSVVGVYGQQIDVSVGLPIGVNVGNHSSQVALGIGNWDTGLGVDGSFQYEPSMGNFEGVIKERLNTLVASFNPPTGSEYDEYVLGIVANPGPYTSTHFYLHQSGSRWIVPPEVLDVKLDYGGSVGWYIDGVAVVEMDIVTSSGIQHFSSENGGAGASPCFIGALQQSLKDGATVLESRYVVPSLQKENGVLPGSILTLRAENRYQYVTINLLDGSVIDYSSPPPAFLKFPPKLEIVKTADGFEFSVSNTNEQLFTIESTTNFVTWELYPAIELTSVTGKKSYRVGTVLGSSQFFRLRLDSPLSIKK